MQKVTDQEILEFASRNKHSIMGAPGAGKTTLAGQLNNILEIPAIHLDALFWKPGWIRTSDEERLAIFQSLTRKPRWILDGNYSTIIDLQLKVTETVLFLDYPRYICYWRVFKRRFSSPPEVAPGCPDKIDLEFIKSIWIYPYTTGRYLKERLPSYNSLKVISLHSPRETKVFCQRLALLCNSPSPQCSTE